MLRFMEIRECMAHQGQWYNYLDASQKLIIGPFPSIVIRKIVDYLTLIPYHSIFHQSETQFNTFEQ